MTERELFTEALHQADPAVRTAYLLESCRGDDRLRARVELLLAVHEAGPTVLGTSPLELLDRMSAEPEPEPQAAETSQRQLAPFLRPGDRPDGLGRLGHYELLAVLGQGGHGIVARAFDEVLQREVAVKVLAPHLAANPVSRKRFAGEARAAGRVRHEHVVAVYAVGDDPLPYQVMEYVPGPNLQQRLDREGPVAPPEAARLARQVAVGLAAAHALGLVHRDVKPANILLTADHEPQVKLTDFGLARAFDDASQTVSGTTIGSPLYMAPEQASGQPVDPRADLFSLGCVLYAMLTGWPPFAAPSTFAVLRRVVEDSPRPVTALVPGVPPGLVAVLDRLLAKLPGDRFPTAEAAAEALADCLTARPPRRRWPVLLAVPVVAAGTWAAVVVNRPAEPRAATPPVAGAGLAEPEWDEAAVGRLPPSEQVRAVVARMLQLNPDAHPEAFEHEERGGVVVRFVCYDTHRVKDLSPLRALPGLSELGLFNRWPAPDPLGKSDPPPDLRPLAGLKLTMFDSLSNEFADLSPLADLPLTAVSLWAAKATSLEPLRGRRLTRLNVGGTPVTDFTPMRGMPLRDVCVNETRFADLSVLANAPLEKLDCQHTQVSDIRPLAGKPLSRLRLRGSPVTDFSVLRELPVEDLSLDYDPAKHADLLRCIPTLRLVNDKPAAKVLGPAQN